MGSCVSMHTDTESDMKKKKKPQTDDDKILIPSPVKPTVVNPQFSPPAHFTTGSKDEAFFDSQPWLDSDCEDDYYSVNGDFTPSRGNTPVHHSFPVGKLQVNKTPAAPIEAASEPSPPDKKKRLSELFKDSLRIEQPVNEENAKVEGDGTPYLSGTNSGRSSGRTPNGEDKSFKSAQCCLPGLLSSRSFRERKKMMRSPARSGG